ncbi:hypothetical protein FB451DRAFT_1221608 [Mycena latifolia]|nr:hypothetical protein FB451DRAFT_1221608 [Mycena latifolia]
MAPLITPRAASRAIYVLMGALFFLGCSLADSFFSPSRPTDTSIPFALNRIVAELRPAFAVLPLLIALFILSALIYYNVSPQEGEVYLEVNTDLPLDLPELEPTRRTLPVGISIVFLPVVWIAGATSFISFKRWFPWSRAGHLLDNIRALALYFLRGLLSSFAICAICCILYFAAKSAAAVRRRDIDVIEEIESEIVLEGPSDQGVSMANSNSP